MVLHENGEDKMAREVTNEILERIGEKRAFLNNKKANFIGHTLSRDCH